MTDLSNLAQPNVYEYVRMRLGRQAPHDDAVGIVELAQGASALVNESLRKAIAQLLARFANGSLLLNVDEAADLLTLAGFLMRPIQTGYDEALESSARSLCELADSESEGVARRARGVLLGLHRPATRDFWLDLDRMALHRPDTATVFEGLSDAGYEHAYTYLATRLGMGLSIADARDMLVKSFRRVDQRNRTVAHSAFVGFLSSGLEETARAELAAAPAEAGLDWAIPEPSTKDRFVSLLKNWRGLFRSGEDPVSARYDVIRRALVALVDEVFLQFDSAQLPVVYDGLTSHLLNPHGDRLAVEAMTTLHLEEELVRRLVVQINGRSWELAEWYLDVRQWVHGLPGERDLLVAIYSAVADCERTPFLRQIVERHPDAAEVLRGAIDDPHFFQVESEMTAGYTESATALEAIAEQAA